MGGCLGVLSILTNSSVNDVMDHAFHAQNLWSNNEISPYDLVSIFIDRLLESMEKNYQDEGSMNELVFNRMNIITTTLGIGTNIRKANNKEELRELMLQTTWIPFITGKGLSIVDQNGYKHIDGGFSRYLHPKCQTYLSSMPFRLDFLWTLSPNLSEEKVLELWNDGLSYNDDDYH